MISFNFRQGVIALSLATEREGRRRPEISRKRRRTRKHVHLKKKLYTSSKSSSSKGQSSCSMTDMNIFLTCSRHSRQDQGHRRIHAFAIFATAFICGDIAVTCSFLSAKGNMCTHVNESVCTGERLSDFDVNIVPAVNCSPSSACAACCVSPSPCTSDS